MSAVLEKLSQIEQQETQQAADNYRDLVAQLACGEHDPELADVQTILRAAGKTAGELSNDVGFRKRRDELRATIAEADKAQARRESIDKKIANANAALEAAKAKHLETLLPLRAELDQIQAIQNQRDEALRQLREQCPDESLLFRRDQNRRDIQTTAVAISNARKQLGDQKQLLAIAQGRNSSWSLDAQPGGDPNLYAERVQRFQAELDELETKLAQLKAESEEINVLILES